MARTYWTLENAGIEKAIGDWGIDDLTRTLVNCDEDTVDLSLGGRRYDAAYLFAFKSTVIVRRERVLNGAAFEGGSQWFVGLVMRPSCRAAGRSENQACSLVGPWWYPNERGFEQESKEFAGFTDGDPSQPALYVTRTSNRIFLNQGPPPPEGGNLPKLTTGDQLIEILEWTLKPFTDAAAPAPFQIGSITLAVDPPIDEVKNITCAEAARKQLRWSPDAVGWFDYTTTPPTFNAKRRADLVASTIDLEALRPDTISVNPRPERQRSFVKIIYERTNTIEGRPYAEIIERVYPDPIPAGPMNQFAGVPFMINLRGSTVTLSVRLATEAIRVNDNDWWLKHLKAFERETIQSFDINPDSLQIKATEEAQTYAALPNELIGGRPSNAVNAQFQKVAFTCTARITTTNGHTVNDHPLHIIILTTSANNGTFVSGSLDDGDAIPINLERDFYEALSVAFFEGNLSFTAAELGGLPSLGNMLNLTGVAQSDWATMNALIQRVTENVSHATTRLEFGSPPHLNLDDLVTLLAVTRNRNITQPYGFRSGQQLGTSAQLLEYSVVNNSGQATGNVAVAVASGSANPNTETDPAKQGAVKHDGPNKISIWNGGPTDGSVRIALGPNGQAGTTQGHDIAFREWDVCVIVDGVKVMKKAMFPSSAPY